MERLLTVKEVAELLQCHPQTVYRNRDLPSIDIPGIGIRYKSIELDKYLERRTQQTHSLLAPISPYKSFELTDIDKFDKIYLKSIKGGNCGPMSGKKARWNYGFGAVYVRKMKSGKERWYVDFVENGKRAREVVKDAQNRSEAILHLQQKVSEAFANARGLERSKALVKFSEFADCFIRDYAKTNKRSWKSDLSRLKSSLIPAFGNLTLKDITPLLIEKCRSNRLESGRSKSSVNREMALLKKMHNLAIDWGYAAQNPVKKVRFFSEKDNLKERVLTSEEELRLLNECAPHLKPILIIALNTGMRLGEILGLKWNQIDFRRMQVRVERTKSGSVRFIPMNLVLSETLSMLRSRNEGLEYVFHNPETGRPLASVKRAFLTACRKAGITGLRFHDLRHTFASRLVERGVDLITVKELLGHSSVKITERYTHPNQSLKQSAVESLVQKDAERLESPEPLAHICHTDEKVVIGKSVILGYSIS